MFTDRLNLFSHYSLTSETLLTMSSKLRVVSYKKVSSPRKLRLVRVKQAKIARPVRVKKSPLISGEVLFGEQNRMSVALPASLVRDESVLRKELTRRFPTFYQATFEGMVIKRRCKYAPKKVFLRVAPEKLKASQSLVPKLAEELRDTLLEMRDDALRRSHVVAQLIARGLTGDLALSLAAKVINSALQGEA